MNARWLICSIMLTLLGAALALASEPTVLTHNGILSTFARTVRDSQYVCRNCDRVFTMGEVDNGLAYRVVCRSGLEYRVVLTPQNAVVVEPAF